MTSSNFRRTPVRLETHDVLADGEHLVSIGTIHFDLGGETKSFGFTEVCHMHDGKISERWGLTLDQGLDELIAQAAGG